MQYTTAGEQESKSSREKGGRHNKRNPLPKTAIHLRSNDQTDDQSTQSKSMRGMIEVLNSFLTKSRLRKLNGKS